MPRTNNINTCKLTVTIVVTLYQVLMSGVLAVGGGGWQVAKGSNRKKQTFE